MFLLWLVRTRSERLLKSSMDVNEQRGTLAVAIPKFPSSLAMTARHVKFVMSWSGLFSGVGGLPG